MPDDGRSPKFRPMRRADQELSRAEAETILREAKTAVLALSGDGGFPYAVPVNPLYHEGKIYFHSAPAGHKIDAVRRCRRVSLCVVAQDEVLPEKLTTAYRSVIVFGRARIIDRPDELRRIAGLIGAAYLIDEAGEEAETVSPAGPPLTESFTNGLDRALRTPLARIVANADSIAAQGDGPVAAAYADYASDIAHAGRHLMGLVDNLVELQAIEQPDFKLASMPIDLADVTRRAAGLLAVRAEAAGVAIRRPGPSEGMGATGDFGRSLQILINLIGNALRYSPRGGEVVVTVEREDGWALTRVSDRGKGIEPEDQARIFEKFERVDPSEPGGNGLGLYIARRLARAMGGDLSVESIPGEGATFTFRLRAR